MGCGAYSPCVARQIGLPRLWRRAMRLHGGPDLGIEDIGHADDPERGPARPLAGRRCSRWPSVLPPPRRSRPESRPGAVRASRCGPRSSTSPRRARATPGPRGYRARRGCRPTPRVQDRQVPHAIALHRAQGGSERVAVGDRGRARAHDVAELHASEVKHRRCQSPSRGFAHSCGDLLAELAVDGFLGIEATAAMV
jgi:hypothetical protein